jgi:hypothetical protein
MTSPAGSVFRLRCVVDLVGLSHELAGIEALTSRKAPTVTSETGWRALRNGTDPSLQSNAKACSSSRAASLKSFNGSMP